MPATAAHPASHQHGVWRRGHVLMQNDMEKAVSACMCLLRPPAAGREKRKKRKDYAFRHHFNEKPSIYRAAQVLQGDMYQVDGSYAGSSYSVMARGDAVHCPTSSHRHGQAVSHLG